MRITKNNAEDLAFAKHALIVGAIKFKEFLLWVEHVICSVDDYPMFFVDFLEQENVLGVIKAMPFSPGLENSDVVSPVLYAIAYLRFENVYDAAYEREFSMRMYHENPEVVDRFYQTFPFINREP